MPASERLTDATHRAFAARTSLAPLRTRAAWMLDGIFIGATRTADMRNMMIVSAVVYFFSVIPLMTLFGNHGLWIGMLISFVVRGVTLGLKYPALEAAASGTVRVA